MPKHSKNPRVVEAMRLDGEAPKRSSDLDMRDLRIAEVSGWMLGNGFRKFAVHGDSRPFGIAIETPKGTMVASYGDYIIMGTQGEFYPCRPDIFAATHEAADHD